MPIRAICTLAAAIHADHAVQYFDSRFGTVDDEDFAHAGFFSACLEDGFHCIRRSTRDLALTYQVEVLTSCEAGAAHDDGLTSFVDAQIGQTKRCSVHSRAFLGQDAGFLSD